MLERARASSSESVGELEGLSGNRVCHRCAAYVRLCTVQDVSGHEQPGARQDGAGCDAGSESVWAGGRAAGGSTRSGMWLAFDGRASELRASTLGVGWARTQMRIENRRAPVCWAAAGTPRSVIGASVERDAKQSVGVAVR